jgi:transglutaminase-like putative cysteine protease
MKKNILAAIVLAALCGATSAHASQFFNFRRRLGTSCEMSTKKAMVEKNLVFAETGNAEIDQAVAIANKKLDSKTIQPRLHLSETKTHDVVKVSAITALDTEGVEQLVEEMVLSQDTPKWPLSLEMTVTVKMAAGDYGVLAQTTNYDPRCKENVIETIWQNLHLHDGHLNIREVELNPIDSHAEISTGAADMPAGAIFLPSMPRLFGVQGQRAYYVNTPRTFVYGSRTVPLVELVSKPHAMVVRFNPLTSAYESLESIEVESHIDNKTVARNIVSYSKTNEYGENVDGAGVREFVASPKIWGARLLSGTVDNLSQVSFDDQDFIDDSTVPLQARLVANQELGYENIGAYWVVDSLNKSTDDKGETQYVYVVDARKEAASKNSVPLTEPANPQAPFLRPTEFVQTDLPEVQAAIKKLKHGFTGTRLEMAQKILKYMPQLIEFDESMIDDNEIVPLKTSEILARGKGVCQHFANVFAAVARAAGIPTKVISGFTFDAKALFGHAWNEIEIQDGVWLPIEPQYENVFDMDYWQYVPLAVSAELDDPTRKDDLVREDWLLTNFVFSLKKFENDRE